jgi:Ca-activated chloride channel homolog
MRFPLAFVFPSDGTFWGEHPYCLLDAQWISDEQREAAQIFRDYLLASAQQALAIDNYLRPIEPAIALHAPLALENGTDPRVTVDTVPGLELPTGDLVNAVIDVFHQTKKPATVILVVDTSGSMNGPKIRNAASSAAQFIQRLNPNDEIYALGFSSAPYDMGQGGRVSEVGETLQATVNTIYAEGGTALYDAMCDAAMRVEALR